MKLDWIDFNINHKVITPKGEGFVRSVDKQSKRVGIKLFKGDYEYFNIDEIELPSGSLSFSLTQQIGQYILLFQRVENRLRDFMYQLLNLNSTQRNELATSLTAGTLIDKITSLIKRYAEKEKISEWKELTIELKELNKIRNTIVHGYLFHYNEKFELDFKSIRIENANGNVELLDFEKLNELNERVVCLYYRIKEFNDSNASKIKTKIINVDNT